MHLSRHQLVPEIQGLRAVAVLAVLIYHIWPTVVPGGYVGVDVFFVISGYLITGSLFKEFEATGRISVAGFYARRIRRLLPAATLVSLAVVLTLPLFPRVQWADIATSVVASSLYVQNWFLADQAVDYLADDAKGPMNHFWSLSVEEQYYILWPLVLLPILALARKTVVSPRAAFGWVVVLIGLCSLAHSILLTPANPGVAYFATTTRAWELALGGALAVFQVQRRIASPMRAALGFTGFIAIGVASLGYNDETSFPGYAALLPTLGAAAIILSSGGQAIWSAARILNSRLFQYLGDISYSLYLWHWPLIVLYGQVTGRSIGPRSGAVLLLASLALAHFSKVLVEDPFRRSGLTLGRTMVAGAASLAFTVALGLGFLVHVSDTSNPVTATELLHGAPAMENPQYDWRAESLAHVVPQPENARKDVPLAFAKRCHQRHSGTEVLSCDFGDPQSRVKIVMIGDSHATHLFPTFEEIASRRSVYFRGLAKSACLFSLEPVHSEVFKRPYTECVEWSHHVIDWLARERPDVVLISQSPAYPMTSVEGMVAAWKKLTEMDLSIRAILSTPWMPYEPSKCIESSEDWQAHCVPARSTVFKPDPTLAAAERLKVPTFDFSGYFCGAEQCPIIIGGVFLYRDRHHMTATFARTLAGPMEKKLAQTSRFKFIFAQED